MNVRKESRGNGHGDIAIVIQMDYFAQIRRPLLCSPCHWLFQVAVASLGVSRGIHMRLMVLTRSPASLATRFEFSGSGCRGSVGFQVSTDP
jgi:hypothetical protein